ncbi:VENN motif pre-toxin domain-containing protein [Gilliamella sp. ESL0254]|nr:VENN motif pre-toxin domain-containing protein [Gilliamella sp. ESL0254]
MGGDIQDVNTGVAASKNAVENNLLNKDPYWTEQDKKEASERIEQVFINNYCGGVDDAACTQKRQELVIDNLKTIGGIIVDFTPVVGDIKGFAEAEDSIDYVIATVGLIPGLGDAVGKLLKEAKVALKLGDTKKASELVQEAQNKVKALDVGSYRELKANEVVGDMLEHDHIPSFAALKKAEEARLGRPLTPTESKKLYNEATTVEVPRDVHQKGPTYGGKNTPEQIQKDATDLCGAVCRDTDALRKNMIEKGYDPNQVEDAINKIIARNKKMGIY